MLAGLCAPFRELRGDPIPSITQFLLGHMFLGCVCTALTFHKSHCLFFFILLVSPLCVLSKDNSPWIWGPLKKSMMTFSLTYYFYQDPFFHMRSDTHFWKITAQNHHVCWKAVAQSCGTITVLKSRQGCGPLSASPCGPNGNSVC